MTSQTFRTALGPHSSPSPDDTMPGSSTRWNGAASGTGTTSRHGSPDLDQRRWLAGLLLLTGALYLWDLSASGWANSFYAAAAQAGSESWKAFFFGSSDAANSITVDKTPLSIWPMALSIRIFGLSSWSLLVPQALMGVASVGLLHATVRRTTGSAGAGLLAGLTLALTPVAVLMFRFDNPDALLVLLLIGSAYATLRGVEATQGAGSSHPVRWLALGGALVGLAFLTKMLQAFLVLPPLALVYLLFAGVPLWKRFAHLLVAFTAMLLSAGWWIAVVELWPAASRPYIGGSQTNSILELTLGYNGFGRLTGDETGSVGGGGGWGETGFLRMFNSEIGSQIAWLLPAALILGVAALVLGRRQLDTLDDRGRNVRAALVLWLGWLLVTALTFSFMAGIFHAYYTVALAPAIAASVAIGAWVLWQRRNSLLASSVLGFTLAFTTALAFTLLARTDWQPWLAYVVATVGFAASLMLVGVRHLPHRVGQGVAAAAVIAVLAAPAAYSLATATTAHTGSIPAAGPGSAGGMGAMGAGPAPGGTTAGTTAGTTGGTTAGGAGSLLNGSTSTAAITELLQTDASSYTWAAAAVGSNAASGYQLASEEPVMAIGGFNGSDPSPTLAQFQDYVANGEIHYFLGGSTQQGGGPGGTQSGGSQASGDIATWVAANFTATTVDGVTVYDLSSGVQ
ncbi:Glycosyl transferase [metagenome]|uniref:Glycosyl transferase n=1 Tax=metagenome TaxID=256318 RepID=A0A2P2CDC0_9ZZZZ